MVIYIHDNTDLESIGLERQIGKACDYAKIPYSTVNIGTWNASPEIPETVRELCIINTQKLSDQSIEKITDFVAGGGTLFLPLANKDPRIGFLLGFKPEAEFATDIVSQGYHLEKPFLPGIYNFDVHKDWKHYGFAKEDFSDRIKVLATASNDSKYPTILENQVGAGHIILINSQNSFQKRDRGFCFAALLSGLEGIPYPIANTSTIFLDDFPCPLFNFKAEPIVSEMNLTAVDYVKNVWWPDMKRLAKKYDIKYSAMVVFDYKNKVEPPFIFDQWAENKIKSDGKIMPLNEYFMTDIAKNGHELALHGYNHVEYLNRMWDNPDFVSMALNSVKKKWDMSNYGKLPVSYVPPSNLIDNRGIDKLKKEMPSLKYICSSYNGESYNGENREFDFDPYNHNFFDYPRITYGFNLDNEDKYNQISTYLYTGIWTHFVHPDDVYQISTATKHQRMNYELRNAQNLGWYKTNGKNYGLYSQFDRYLKNLKTDFPLIRFIPAGKAAPIVLDWRASAFKHSSKNGIYQVEEINPKESASNLQYWFLYISAENCHKIENSFKNQVIRFSKMPFLNGYLYNIQTKDSKICLPELNFGKTSGQLASQQMIQKVRVENEKYRQQVIEIQKEYADTGEDYDKKLKLEIAELKEKMLSEPKIDSTVWNRYSKYLMWDDKGGEVWDLLDAHCKQYPISENILYSQELSKYNDYPNEKLREKWLYAQIEVHPNDIFVLQSYIDGFNEPENKEKIKLVFERLIKVDDCFETYLQYLQFLLLYEPKSALVELQKINPDKKYEIVASDVSWLYADNYQYQKAYDWAALSPDIDFKAKMPWLIEMKSYTVLEYEYQRYIEQNPTDYQAKAIMCEYYHMTGKFSQAWILANSLPDCKEKESLRKMMNQDVKYVDVKEQMQLINEQPDFFYPSVKKELIKTNRLENGDFVAYNTSLESNRQYLSAFKNVFSYNFYNEKGFLNSLGLTYSQMFSLKYPVEDPDNVTHNVYGLQYQLTSPKTDEKWKYWTRVRGEYSNQEKYYVHFGAGANFSKDKRFTNTELKIFPMENGPSYSKNIYRIQSNFYKDGYFFDKINASLSLEGNFYTKSKGNQSYYTNNSFEGTATGKVIWDDGKEKKSRLLPLVELSYLRSSIGESTLELSSGYPYWIIKERFYSGGGLGWKYHYKDLNSFVETSWFYDTYSNDFKRFIGNLSYQLWDYTALTGNFEMYVQSKYYSNVIQFGVKYNLKQKTKKGK